MDGSAARGLFSRRGVGKIRHIATRYVWLQGRIAGNNLSIVIVPAVSSRVDMLTKPMTIVPLMGAESREGSTAAGRFLKLRLRGCPRRRRAEMALRPNLVHEGCRLQGVQGILSLGRSQSLFAHVHSGLSLGCGLFIVMRGFLGPKLR